MKNIQTQIGKIPARSVLYLLICFVIVLIFYFVAIYPYQRSLNAIDMKTREASVHIEKQNTLLPLYEKIKKIQHVDIPEGLPLPEKKGLSREEIDAVSSLLKKITDKYGMEILSVSPDVATMTEKSNDIMVAIRLKGQFHDFRKFMIELGGAPYLDRVEELEITQETGNKEFYLKVWLVIV
ncbi:MAG TPA: hypothetical protein PKZ42_01470 [Syntrophales bacterium]|nr:hypothetical protein [Syntrophales bacterium]